VQAVAVFFPTVSDVCAVVHVGNQNVFDARVHLRLGLLHRLAGADDDEDDAGSSGDEPLAVELFDVLDVGFVGGRLLKHDCGILGECIESFVVIERKRRNYDPDADLKPAADFEFRIQPLARSQKNWPIGVIIPACWMLIVG
jgi:hypothetical protein